MRMILATTAALLLSTGMAFADSGKDNPSDGDKGQGNQPHAPGQSTNPQPGKLWQVPTFSPSEEHLILAGDNVAPGSGNWGGGPGNSGPGDKNGGNDKSKDGGQTPNDDK